jgi:hypothetical protein
LVCIVPQDLYCLFPYCPFKPEYSKKFQQERRKGDNS